MRHDLPIRMSRAEQVNSIGGGRECQFCRTVTGEIADSPCQRAVAVALHTRVIERNPGYALAYFDRAQTRAATGDAAGALEDNSRGREVNPTFFFGRYSRARLRADAGRLEEALADLDPIVKGPGYPSVVWSPLRLQGAGQPLGLLLARHGSRAHTSSM